MKPAQDKPHQPEKPPARKGGTAQFSEQDAEGRALSEDRRQHGKTVAQPGHEEKSLE